MKTNNLLVEAFFVPSVFASQDRENGLVRLASKALGGGPIRVPNHFLVGRFSGKHERAARQAQDKQGNLRFHTVFPNLLSGPRPNRCRLRVLFRFQVLAQNIFPIEFDPVLFAKLPGFVQCAYRFVQITAVVIQHGEQVQPVAQIVVTVQSEDMSLLGRVPCARNLRAGR